MEPIDPIDPMDSYLFFPSVIDRVTADYVTPLDSPKKLYFYPLNMLLCLFYLFSFKLYNVRLGLILLVTLLLFVFTVIRSVLFKL